VIRLGLSGGVAVVALLIVASSSALAGRAPSGDRASIAFYRQVAAAYRHVGTLSATRRGYISYTVAGASFRYVDGKPAPPGYRAAVESIVATLRNGRTINYVDHVRAPRLPPLTIIENATGVWAALGNQPGSCFHKNPRSSGVFGWGYQFVGIYGQFAPMQRSGRSTVTIQSTYAWGKSGAQASETDHFSATKKYWRSLRVQITGGAGAFSWGMTGFRQSPATPKAPTPIPSC
jgi:hypothetical protein